MTSEYVNAMTAIVSSLLLFLSCIIALRALRLQMRIKRVDIMLSFQQRYNTLLYGDNSKKVTHGEQAAAFYEMFWWIQYDEYQLWQLGLVEDVIYTGWLTILKRQIAANALGARGLALGLDTLLSLTDSWELACRSIHDLDFKDMVRFLKQGMPYDIVPRYKNKRGRQALKKCMAELI